MNKLMCKDSKYKILNTATVEVFSKFFVQKVDAVHAAISAADAPVVTDIKQNFILNNLPISLGN